MPGTAQVDSGKDTAMSSTAVGQAIGAVLRAAWVDGSADDALLTTGVFRPGKTVCGGQQVAVERQSEEFEAEPVQPGDAPLVQRDQDVASHIHGLATADTARTDQWRFGQIDPAELPVEVNAAQIVLGFLLLGCRDDPQIGRICCLMRYRPSRRTQYPRR